jgi:hypothetical protein
MHPSIAKSAYRNLRVNTHSTHNKLDMKSQLEDFAERFETPWSEFAEGVLPRKLRHVLLKPAEYF